MYKQFKMEGHNGIDFALPSDTEVLACNSGFVSKIGFESGGYGTYIKIKHSWGVSTYAHLKLITIGVDDAVSSGDRLGFSDSTGFSTGPHLHFGIKPNNEDSNNGYLGYIDPLPYLKEISDSVDTVKKIVCPVCYSEFKKGL